MVERQLAVNRINNGALLAAFLDVPRHLFMTSRLRARAYGDCSIPLGIGGRVMPSPLTTARLVEAILPGDGEEPLAGKEVLTAAAGSGYCTLLVRKLGARVDYAEAEPELAAGMKSSFAACGIAELPKIVSPRGARSRYDYVILEASIVEPPKRFGRLIRPGGKLAAVRRRPGESFQYPPENLGEIGTFTPVAGGFSYQGVGQGWLPAYVI